MCLHAGENHGRNNRWNDVFAAHMDDVFHTHTHAHNKSILIYAAAMGRRATNRVDSVSLTLAKRRTSSFIRHQPNFVNKSLIAWITRSPFKFGNFDWGWHIRKRQATWRLLRIFVFYRNREEGEEKKRPTWKQTSVPTVVILEIHNSKMEIWKWSGWEGSKRAFNRNKSIWLTCAHYLSVR